MPRRDDQDAHHLDHVHRAKGTFGSSFGGAVGCVLGIAFAVCLLIAGSVAGCVFLVGGCTAVGSKAVQEAADRRNEMDSARQTSTPTVATDAGETKKGAAATPTNLPGIDPADLARRPDGAADGENRARVGVGKAVVLDGVSVVITHAGVIKVPLLNLGRDSNSKDDLFVVIVRISHGDPTRKVDYVSWRNERLDPPKLRDNFGNTYPLARFGFGVKIAGAIEAASVYSDKAAEDILVFQRPVPDTAHLDLDLSGENVGLEDTFRFRFTKQPDKKAATPDHPKPPNSVEPLKPSDVPKPEEEAKPAPRPKSREGYKTITPDDKRPVPVALDARELAVYRQAAAAGRTATTDRLVKDGLVQLVAEPTEVRHEYTRDGLAYVRLGAGVLKGRLAVVEAQYLK